MSPRCRPASALRRLALLATLSSAAVAQAPPAPGDPALLHVKLLEQLDAQADAACARAHVEARLALDAAAPIPYFGEWTEPVEDGLRIKASYPGYPGYAAGLRNGDVILTVAGVPLHAVADFTRVIRAQTVGQPVEFRVRREGQPLTFQVAPCARPQEDEDEAEQFPDLFPPRPPAVLPRRFAFDGDPEGQTPAALESVLGGTGRPGHFVAVRDAGGCFLRQDDADPSGIRFPMALVRDLDADDLVARVRFRYRGGYVDRAAGVVLHWQDPANYLVARANAEEGDFRLMRSLNGVRKTLPGGLVLVDSNDPQWHTIEFRAEGPKLTAVLDGKATVTSYDTCWSHGRVGLWTKSDSATEFDDFAVTAPEK